MLRLTRNDLMHVAPRPKSGPGAIVWDAYVAALTSTQGAALMKTLSNPKRVTNALAQMTCETNLAILWESGAYSASRITAIFGPAHHSSAITPLEAAHIASLPVFSADGREPRAEALFERAYGYKTKKGRQLGNTQPGDGFRFRGLGLNQMTGRWAHEQAAKKLGISIDKLVTPMACIAFFMFEWERLNCNAYADQGDTISIRKLINTGSTRTSVSRVNGLPEAMAALKRAQNVITVADFVDDTLPAPEQQVAAAVDTDTDLAPINSDKPVSLMQSTEMQGATVVSGSSAYTAQNQWFDVIPRAFGKATETGRFSVSALAFALISDPVFWGAMAASGLTGIGIYMMIQRYKRFFVHGV